MTRTIGRRLAVALACLAVAPGSGFAEDAIATVVHARTGNGYKREMTKKGTFKPEYYALSNGGRVKGTAADLTVDKVSFSEVAGIAMRLLSQQNYHYAQREDQAGLLLVIQWGNTIAPNGTNKEMNVNAASSALTSLLSLQREFKLSSSELAGSGPSVPFASTESAALGYEANYFESMMARLLADNRMRDEINGYNARLLGYGAEIIESNDIRRWAGGGDRYTDLIADVEEARYYIIITAYDFKELKKHNKMKQLWITRVSVRAPGNRFDESLVAMMKGASKYFGQDSGRLIRGEESRGLVEMGDLKFLGEAKDLSPPKDEAAAKAK
jgi:hypothetical protein